MEPNTTQAPDTSGKPAAANAANPVMDVVAPPPAEAGENKQDKEADPVDKLAAEARAEIQASAKQEKPKGPPLPPRQKQPHDGTGIAIIATVIIVLGLAALATFAYTQTAK